MLYSYLPIETHYYFMLGFEKRQVVSFSFLMNSLSMLFYGAGHNLKTKK